jgi:hypothetical protein
VSRGSPDVLAPDAGMQEMMARFSGMDPQSAPAAGAGLQVSADFELMLGRVLERQAQRDHDSWKRRRLELAAAIFPFSINPLLMTLAAGAGTLDVHQALGVRDGFALDVKLLVAASFTAGSVSVFRQGAADMNQRGFFPSAGTLTYGGQSLMVMPGERLVLTATGITGNVTVSGDVILVRQDYVGEYLL